MTFGRQKINLRPTGAEDWHTATGDEVGSEDLRFVTAAATQEVLDHFAAHRIEVIDGPVEKTGALGPMTSIYCSDLDGNLIEVAHYDD